MSDPRPEHATGKAYTVDCLGNIVGGRRTVYHNQPIDVLFDATRESIKKKEAVWFGCDVRTVFSFCTQAAYFKPF